jgi:hypothetical protein
MGLVPEFGTGFGYVRKSQGNIAGLRGLTIEYGFPAKGGFEHFDQAA